MNRTTFRDLWVGGVSVKKTHVLLRFGDLLVLNEKQIHHVIKFSFLFGLTDSFAQLDSDSIQIKIKMD